MVREMDLRDSAAISEDSAARTVTLRRLKSLSYTARIGTQTK